MAFNNEGPSNLGVRTATDRPDDFDNFSAKNTEKFNKLQDEIKAAEAGRRTMVASPKAGDGNGIITGAYQPGEDVAED